MERGYVWILVCVTMLMLLVIVWANNESISDFFFKGITGQATGTINLTVQQKTNYSLPAATDTINWSSGRVTAGEDYAILSTTNGTVENGNWTPVSHGFVIENDGNVDLVLSLSFGKTAGAFLGGTSPEYNYNVTDNEAGSCTVALGFTLATWNAVSSGTTAVCSNFSFGDSADEVRVDFLLKIPDDSYIDTRGDAMTVSVEAV